MQSIVDIEICKIHTDLNVADPLTKLLLQEKLDHTLVLFGFLITWRCELARLLTLVNPLGVSHIDM